MAGPVGAFRSGKGTRATVNGSNLTIRKYDADYRTDDLETQNFEAGIAGAFDQGTFGFLYLDLSLAGDWNANQKPTGAPPGIFPRDDLGQVTLYTNLVDNTFWSVPQSRVLSSKNGSDVKGLVSFAATLKNNGSFTAP